MFFFPRIFNGFTNSQIYVLVFPLKITWANMTLTFNMHAGRHKCFDWKIETYIKIYIYKKNQSNCFISGIEIVRISINKKILLGEIALFVLYKSTIANNADRQPSDQKVSV